MSQNLMSSIIKSLTKREALAFKAGGWAALPVDYVVENYGIPFAKRHFGEKAFYAHISKMPRKYGRRRLTTPMIISQESAGEKRSGGNLLRAYKRARIAKEHGGGSGERKVHFNEISTNTQNIGVLVSELLYDLEQGAEYGQRLGAKIYARYIDVRGFLRNLNTTLTNTVRIVFVQDNKPQVGSVNVNLFASESTDNVPKSFGTAGDAAQITKIINPNRFRVLSDRRFKLGAQVSANDGGNFTYLKYRVNIDRYFEYLSDTTLTDKNRINPNMYVLLFCELENSASGTAVLQRDIQMYEHFSG